MPWDSVEYARTKRNLDEIVFVLGLECAVGQDCILSWTGYKPVLPPWPNRNASNLPSLQADPIWCELPFFVEMRDPGMRRRTRLAIVLAVIATLETQLAADEPTGTWKVQMSFGGREGRISILKLQTEGDQLTGVMLDSQGSSTPIERPSYKDGRISFEIPRERNGQRFSTQYTGTLAEDAIKGTIRFQRRGNLRTLTWEARRTTSEANSPNVEVPPVAADIDLNSENYEVWRDHILPDSSEMTWERIPWLTTFKDGILAADEAGKPLLLWTMNGHPLGCT